MAERPFSSDVIDAIYSGYQGDSFDADVACDAVLTLLAAHEAEVRAKALEDAARALFELELPWGPTVRKRFFEGVQAAVASLRARAAAERGGQ